MPIRGDGTALALLKRSSCLGGLDHLGGLVLAPEVACRSLVLRAHQATRLVAIGGRGRVPPPLRGALTKADAVDAAFAARR
jgi:hypothetical protein